jgi:sugar phosphate isomerase/epimerase
MKIGMNLLLWATRITEEHYPHLEKIKSIGFDGVEIPIFSGDDAHYQRLRKKLDELQLKTSTVTIATPEANPISPEPSIRRAAAERLKTIVRQSAILGADIVCGPFYQALGMFSGAGPTEEEIERAADVHREVADEAQRHAVYLAVEPLNRFECYFLNVAAAAAAYVRRVGHPNFKAMFDTFHANIEEENLPKAFFENAAEIIQCARFEQRPRCARARSHRFSLCLSGDEVDRLRWLVDHRSFRKGASGVDRTNSGLARLLQTSRRRGNRGIQIYPRDLAGSLDSSLLLGGSVVEHIGNPAGRLPKSPPTSVVSV